MRLIAAALIISGCAGASQTETGASTPTDEQPVLDAMIDSESALVTDFGPDWELVEQWFTEGGHTEWNSGCPAFDDLDGIFNHGLPTTAVWQSANGDLIQRTASLDWDAATYPDLIETAASTCSSLSVDGNVITIQPSGKRLGALELGDDVTLAALWLDAYPQAGSTTDPATEVGNPQFVTGRDVWMVALVRHNVVSQLIYSPVAAGTDDSIDDANDELDRLVSTASAALQEAPIVASGPITKPAPPPSVAYQVMTGIELTFDSDQCRNDGGLEYQGVWWALASPVPFEWRNLGPIVGGATFEGTEATFVGPDGTTLNLTTGAVPAVCTSWLREPPPTPATNFGDLDCGSSTVIETRVPDDGQSPEDLAVAAEPGVVEVEAGMPLQWWGVDQDGDVVVGVFLGDVENADYQVVTCSTE